MAKKIKVDATSKIILEVLEAMLIVELRRLNIGCEAYDILIAALNKIKRHNKKPTVRSEYFKNV